MFHVVYKISKSIILPIIFIIVETQIKRSQRQTFCFIDICGKWLAFWVIGFGGISVGLMQALNPAYTANLLGVQMSDMIIVRELGFAQTGIGIIGLLSIRLHSFRKPAAIAFGIFILGATIIHLTRLGYVGFDEIVSLADDVWTLGAVVLVLVRKQGGLMPADKP